jgi:hypothetical protein
LYRNNGNGTFNEVATFSGLTETASGRAVAWIDANQDGPVDLLVINADGAVLYENPGRSGSPQLPAARQTIRQRGEYLISAVAWLMNMVWV